MFINPTKNIIIACHVNDFIITSLKRTNIDELIRNISNKIKVQYIGEISTFLGYKISINRATKTLYIHQTKYTRYILNKYNKKNTRGYDTPFEAGIKLTTSPLQASQSEIQSFQRQIGALLYLSLKTRLDIAFAVAKCSRYMSNPDSSHWKAFERI